MDHTDKVVDALTKIEAKLGAILIELQKLVIAISQSDAKPPRPGAR